MICYNRSPNACWTGVRASDWGGRPLLPVYLGLPISQVYPNGSMLIHSCVYPTLFLCLAFGLAQRFVKLWVIHQIAVLLPPSPRIGEIAILLCRNQEARQ